MEEKGASGHIEGLPTQVLSEYALNILSGEKKFAHWDVVCAQGHYLILESHASDQHLEAILSCLERCYNQEGVSIPKLLKTPRGKLHFGAESRNFFVMAYRHGQPFCPSNALHLTACVRALGRIHGLSRLSIEDKSASGFKGPWVSKMQERLMELLLFYRRLQKRRAHNDFERLYLENFDEMYNQGQEAIEQRVMSGQEGIKQVQSLVINRFPRQDILIEEGQAMYLNIGNGEMGHPIEDFALFLRSFLPYQRWPVKLFQELLKTYEAYRALEEGEKHLLQSLLRFPTRFWALTYHYLEGKGREADLTCSLKKSILECKWREQCLNRVYLG